MFKKLLSVALASLVVSMFTAVPASAQSPAETETQQAEKVKGKVTRLGTGKQARVEVKLRDNTKLKGYIGEIAEEHFTVIDPKHGTVTLVSYSQVLKIKNTNSDLFALGLGAAVISGVVIVVMASMRGS
ncbi:MAG: hypothetical protein ABI923_10610 [bacterium]